MWNYHRLPSFYPFVSSFLSQIWSISSSPCLFDYLLAHQCQSSAVANLPSSSPISNSVCESCQRLFSKHTTLHKHASIQCTHTHRLKNVVMGTYGWNTVGTQSIFSPVVCNGINTWTQHTNLHLHLVFEIVQKFNISRWKNQTCNNQLNKLFLWSVKDIAFTYSDWATVAYLHMQQLWNNITSPFLHSGFTEQFCRKQ